MPDYVADNITEVGIIGQWTNARQVVNVIQITTDGPSPEEVARDVLNNWQDDMLGSFCNNYTVLGARWASHDSGSQPSGFLVPDPAKQTQGQLPGQAGPPNVAVLVHKRIQTTTQDRAGRLYLPAIQEGDVDENGIIAAATVTGIQASCDAFFDGLTDEGIVDQHIVVMHKVPPPAQSPHSNVTALQVDVMVATQRRRLRR